MDFREQVIYQIYPKSFYDSNNDGIGDLPGIIAKIPYLTRLNIDMIWFNPFYVSPQNDNGYDISDYYAIDPKFGTMADFEELVRRLSAHNIGVMLDMVLNHCSTEHEWFQKAVAGDKKYQKFFYIREPKANGDLPNHWTSKFGGPAWSSFGDTGKYYLHLFDSSQADLDWHNPQVRQELFRVVNFWRQKGVKGFRFDVINVIGKDEKLQDAPAGIDNKTMYTDTPIVQQYLQELNQATFGQDKQIVTVGEMSSANIESSIMYTRADQHQLNMVFNFHHLKADYQNNQKWTKPMFDFSKLKKTLNTWQLRMNQEGGWNALFWNNHDQPWALSRFGDPINYREKSAEMLATSIHLLRGTPYIYQGEEIGMINPDYRTIEDYVDVETKNAYKKLLKEGCSKQQALAIIHERSRDNSRTPMHWDASPKAGFTKGQPWLRPTGQQQINVAAELAHGEIFNYYQKLIKLRKTYPVIVQGDYHPLNLDHPQVFAYVRKYQRQVLLVFNNFFAQQTVFKIPLLYQQQPVQVLISNYQLHLTTIPSKITLRPYEAVACLISN